MTTPQKIGRLMLLYIQKDLNFLQAWKLKRWRSLSEANEQFFQRETSLDHIRERFRVHKEYLPVVTERTRGAYPNGGVKTAPRKQAIVIRMLKTAAIFVGSLFLLVGGYISYQVFFNSASPKNFAMMITLQGQRIVMNDYQLGVSAGIKNIKVKKKEKGELLFMVPNDLKSTNGQSDTLWSSDKWRFEMLMADKSDIWMNLSTTIGYPQNYNSSDSVSYYIAGEAFFKIPGNTNKYYEIRTDSLLIRANGAALDVHSNAYGTGSAVLLVSGIASIEPLHQSGGNVQTISLNPGEQVKWLDGKFIVDEHPDIKTITAWKR